LEFVFDSDKNNQNETFSMMPQGASPMGDHDIFETPKSTPRRKTRRTVANGTSDVEFTEPRKPAKRTKGPKVNYVKPVSRKRKSAATKFEWSWTKAGWMVCGALVLRLIFMEGGVVDFNSMENTLVKKEYTLQSVRQENADLIQEIHKLRTSPQYQKKITRDHLGVIAKDEYLVLFSKDSAGSSI
jgi:cell division protein FtsB